MVDVNPTLEGVIGFAEGETAFHSGVEKKMVVRGSRL